MDRTTERHCDLRTFEDVSLWQLIPSGQGHALSYLRDIVDYVLNERPARLPSICILGKEGKQTHARAFLNAVAVDSVRQIEASILQPYGGIRSFFDESSRNTGFIIRNAELLASHTHEFMYGILSERRFPKYNPIEAKIELIPVHGTIILTASPPYSQPIHALIKQMDHIVELPPYTPNHELLKLVLYQRIRYCALNAEENVLDAIVVRGGRTLSRTIRLLQACVVIVRGQGRSKITVEDVRRASALCQACDIAKAKP